MRVRNFVEGKWNLPGTLRNVSPPWGLWGGKPGGTSCYMLKLPGENDFTVMDVHHHMVPVDSEAIVRTGGGGGWGDPLERDPEKVRWDVVEGFVSLGAARDAYGVVLDADDMSIDRRATDALRAELRASAPPDAEQGPFLAPSEPAE
jgi:N-methylhydantoinase B